ncbi:hypothetical protein ACWV26_05315 [Rummeliibacillus sp. JY-2-4R]
MVLEGIIHLRQMKGPNLLYLNEEPLAKTLLPYDGKEMTITFTLPGIEKKLKGIAEIFYFEGKDGYGGDKFTNDLDIEDFDCIEWLSTYEEQSITITID